MSSSSGPKVKKVMTRAVDLIYDFFLKKDRVSVWLYENSGMKIEGVIVGMDEYMNIVLDKASEVTKNGEHRDIGKILLKGDCITLIQRANV